LLRQELFRVDYFDHRRLRGAFCDNCNEPKVSLF
jgi:hypothetical protein